MPSAARYLARVRNVGGIVRHEVRTARRKRVRPAQISSYLASTSEPRLQIGAGWNPLDGWLNTDFGERGDDIVFLDATERFPLPDESFTHVFSEHVIEHLPYGGGTHMLAEVHRILRPGGRVRIATPCLETLVALVTDGLGPEGLDDEQRHYVEHYRREFFPDMAEIDGVFVLNQAVRAWGHQFIWGRDTMRSALEAEGFAGVEEFAAGKSNDEALHDLEAHGRFIGDERVNSFETMVFEAVKH